jgi:hypothetical protein
VISPSSSSAVSTGSAGAASSLSVVCGASWVVSVGGVVVSSAELQPAKQLRSISAAKRSAKYFFIIFPFLLNVFLVVLLWLHYRKLFSFCVEDEMTNHSIIRS